MGPLPPGRGGVGDRFSLHRTHPGARQVDDQVQRLAVVGAHSRNDEVFADPADRRDGAAHQRRVGGSAVLRTASDATSTRRIGSPAMRSSRKSAIAVTSGSSGMGQVCSSERVSAQLSDGELAAEIARGAGRILLGVRHGGLLDGRLIGDAGDQIAQAWIGAALRRRRPHDAVLSGRSRRCRRPFDSGAGVDHRPLDGTSEFCHGTAGLGGSRRTDRQRSAHCRGRGHPRARRAVPLRRRRAGRGSLTGRIAVSRYGGSYESAHVANALGLQRVSIGSAGAKAGGGAR